LVLQNVQTNPTVRIDVTMVDTSREVDLGWFEWIIRREMNIKEEYTTGVW
jgi:hypothetical protein